MILARTIASVLCLGFAMIIIANWVDADPGFWRALLVYAIPANLLLSIYVVFLSGWFKKGT